MGKLDYLNSLLNKVGFEILRYNKGTNALLRRKAIIERLQIDFVLDVGANIGTYGKELRRIGYTGHIASFEPLSVAFKQLEKASSHDPNWEIYNFALGSESKSQIINVSQNLHSSSLLEILETHTKAERTAAYVNKEEIQIKTLDSIFADIIKSKKNAFLKIDTQGFELNVLKGAFSSFQYIKAIQLELSLQQLYASQPLYNEILNFLHDNNYKLIDLEPGFADKSTGTLLQFDGIFSRNNL